MGDLKLISPLELLTNFKVVFRGIDCGFFLEETYKKSMLTNFQPFFSKIDFLKKVKILIFPKNGKKIKIKKKVT